MDGKSSAARGGGTKRFRTAENTAVNSVSLPPVDPASPALVDAGVDASATRDC
jgi:hypothetical protein